MQAANTSLYVNELRKWQELFGKRQQVQPHKRAHSCRCCGFALTQLVHAAGARH